MNKLDIFTARGRVLVQIVHRPGITVKELTQGLFLTKRTIWGVIGDLRRMGYLKVTKVKRGAWGERREHHYSISELGLSELRKLVEHESIP